jgi:capsular polysaccharide biosynthesis protein
MRPEESRDPSPVEPVPAGPPDPSSTFDTERALLAIRDRWWLLLLMPVVALIVASIWMRFEPYHTTVKATVLLPGDTEDPGNTERPELMMLDDLPSLIRSWVFAEGVHAGMQGTDATVAEVQGSLDGSRYSRVLTVTVSDGSADRVSEIAESVESQLPTLINDYLVPAEGEQATVRIIDPPGVPERQRENDVLQLFLIGVTALLAGAIIAVAAGPKGATPQSAV